MKRMTAMPRATLPTVFLAVVLVGCSSAQYVTGDSREMFDTAKGMYGGNEFNARSPEGRITVANEKPADPAVGAAPAPSGDANRATTAAAGAPAVMTAAAGPAATSAPAGVAGSASASAATTAATIVIDANAYAAVFGDMPAPVRPSADQLLRLDSLSLVAADSARVDLQTKILACRRAGESCRITHR